MAKEEPTPDEVLAKKLSSRLGVACFDSPSIKWWNSTGSPVLDLRIRDWRPGGWPGGKWIDIYGPSQAAKTGLALRAARACQERGGKVYFVNPPEQGLDAEYLTKNRVTWTEKPSHNWIPINPFSLEACCGAIEDIVSSEMEADTPIIIIVDPLSSLGPHADTMDEKEINKSKQAAAGAKFLHGWFRRGILYYLAGTKITVLATRHQTSTPRVEFGQVDHTTHGVAPDFYSWIRVRMKQTVMEDPLNSKARGAGAWQTATLRKNKSGRPGGEITMPWYYDTGWDAGLEVMLSLFNSGTVVKKGGKVLIGTENRTLREWCELYETSVNVKDLLLGMLLDSGGKKLLKSTIESGEEE